MVSPDDIRLVLTCSACPEQYDAFLGETEVQVGYLRLRWGTFRVDCPDCGGETVYIADIGAPESEVSPALAALIEMGEAVSFMGCFDDDAQQAKYLGEARKAIAEWVGRQKGAWVPQEGYTGTSGPAAARLA